MEVEKFKVELQAVSAKIYPSGLNEEAGRVEMTFEVKAKNSDDLFDFHDAVKNGDRIPVFLTRKTKKKVKLITQ